jgi:uncharacterized protein (TIGR01777 family)
MQKHILLTGGTGVLGRHLTEALLSKGCKVSHLSRSPGKNPQVKTFVWNIEKGTIDDHCLDAVDTIVHLAGTAIADKRWTEERKDDIVKSRTESIRLIYALMQKREHQVTTIISASGIGYYSDRGDELLTEESAPAHDFLGTCCIEWERAVDEGKAHHLRIVKFRTGIVLALEGGALPQLAKPVKWGFGAALGNGKQWMPWIHLQDVTDMYLMAIENEHLDGTYNMAAPHPVTNKQLIQAVAKQLHRPLWLPGVPAFVLKTALGEMSTVVLGSTKASVEKIQRAGYQFKFPKITEALKDIYG